MPQTIQMVLQAGQRIGMESPRSSSVTMKVQRSEIDDTAGSGAIDKTWSADKLTAEFADKADKADTVLTTTLSRGRKANTTTGNGSLAFGNNVEASNQYASALGTNTEASGTASHAEGLFSVASKRGAHAEGEYTTASGNHAHAEGFDTTASGMRAHAEGDSTTASGSYSHAEGTGTVANHRAQHVFGEFNAADPSSATASSRGTYVEIVGNGSSQNESNARTLDWNGNEELAGDLKINKGTANEKSMSSLSSEVSGIGAATLISGNKYRLAL